MTPQALAILLCSVLAACGGDGEITDTPPVEKDPRRFDVVVFSATPGGILASIAAARAGQTVVLLEPTRWVGGMMSGGLAKTDKGARGHEIIGGLTAEFFQRVRTAEAARRACPGSCTELYDFEPGVAERVFEAMLSDAGVIIQRSAQLLAVQREGSTIRGLMTSQGMVLGEVFIDASYEGDLMALTGVPYRVGREARQFAEPTDDPDALPLQEDDAGIRRYRLPRGIYVDPYRTPGNPASGTLPFIESRPPTIAAEGSEDSRVMAYTYRLCVTDDPANRIPFDAPATYDPGRYEIVARFAQSWAQTGADMAEAMFNPAPTVLSLTPGYYKYDLNGGSTFSTDMTAPDLNQSYVEADEVTRAHIRTAYRDYIRGLIYFWQTDPRFGGLNEKLARFGYCKDEFTDRGGWPQQLYVRVARRMMGEYTMNQNDVMQNGRRPPIADPVGFGSYDIDMHTHRYFAGPVNWPDGDRRDALVLEGFWIVRVPNDEPYPISFRSLVPRSEHATNLLNPVTLSATHVAYSSLRMEPTFMILGEAAGTAAAIASELDQNVQAVSYVTLRQRLLANGQILPN